MNNKILIAVFIVVFALTSILGIYFLKVRSSKGPGGIDVISKSQGGEMVRNFFTAISQGNGDAAASMLTTMMVSSEAGRKKYADQFNSFQKFELVDLKYVKENTYQARLEVEIKPGSDIEKYGWVNGSNTRWVITEKDNNIWMIGAITSSL